MESNGSNQTEQQLYVLGMARQNLSLVIDQVESITDDDTYADILKGLDKVKTAMDGVLND